VQLAVAGDGVRGAGQEVAEGRAEQAGDRGGAASAGIVLGAKVPVILTSRADSRDTRIASCAIALMLAHHYRLSPP